MGGAEIVHTGPDSKEWPMEIVWERRERERQISHATASDGRGKAQRASRSPNIRDSERCQQRWESSTVLRLEQETAR